MDRWTPGLRLIGVFTFLAVAAGCATVGASEQPTNNPPVLIGDRALRDVEPGDRTGANAPIATPAAPAPHVPAPTVPAAPVPTPVTPSPGRVAELVANPHRCEQVRAQARLNPPLFTESSIFNTPAACLQLHPEWQSWSSRWFNYANYPGRSNPSRRGEINVAFDEYSTPIYDKADATGWIKVFHPDWAWASDLGKDSMIPWNPSWEPAGGTDAEMTIVDYETGQEWSLWGVMLKNRTGCFTLGNVLAGFDILNSKTSLCVWVGNIGRNADGSVSDGKNGDGYSFVGDRGMGRLMSRTLLPTLDEVEKGSINHAVNMETYATMFGPGCTAAQISSGNIGTDCGYAVAPATRLEFPERPLPCYGDVTQPFTNEGRSKSIPEGMRFILNKSDAEIEAWLDSRGYVGARRNTAKIFAVALRDYGWIVSDSTCWGSSMAVDGVANPKSRSRWKALGITNPASDGSSLLKGLITSEADVITLKPNHDTLFTTVHGTK